MADAGAPDGWPSTATALIAEQARLAAARPPAWRYAGGPVAAAGCFVCFPRGTTDRGEGGDRAWAAAAVVDAHGGVAVATVEGTAPAAYVPGLLALREGPLLANAVHALHVAAATTPDVLLVNAAGRDHPRRSGLAVQLGAMLDVPTIGVTHRPLLATGAWPADETGADAPLRLDVDVVAAWLRTHAGTRPLVVHAGWRVDVHTAVAVVRALASADAAHARTPRPLRLAREAARSARAAADATSRTGERRD